MFSLLLFVHIEQELVDIVFVIFFFRITMVYVYRFRFLGGYAIMCEMNIQ